MQTARHQSLHGLEEEDRQDSKGYRPGKGQAREGPHGQDSRAGQDSPELGIPQDLGVAQVSRQVAHQSQACASHHARERLAGAQDHPHAKAACAGEEGRVQSTQRALPYVSM